MTLETKKATFLKTISNIEKNLKIINVHYPDIVDSHTKNIDNWKKELNNLSAVQANLDEILINIDKKLKKYENSTSNAKEQVLRHNFNPETSPIRTVKEFRCPKISLALSESDLPAPSNSPAASAPSYISSFLAYLNPFSYISSAPQSIQEAKTSSTTDQSSQKPEASSSNLNKWERVKPEARGLRKWTGEEARREEERKNQKNTITK